MNYNHFIHVTQTYPYIEYNRWVRLYAEKIDIARLYIIGHHGVSDIVIKIKHTKTHLFYDIHSHKLAKEVIQYIRDTEILFI